MAANTFKIGQPLVVGALASDPGSADNGTIYYNTVSGKLRQYVSGGWADAGASVLSDDIFRIIDDVDATKQIAFQANGITTATTRTITMPDANVNLGLVASAIQSTEKGSALGVATLDSSGLIPSAQLPPIAITDVFVVANQAARLALTAEKGDVAIQTDTGLTYILSTNSPSTNADWKVITAAGAVTTVNGQTGTVSLTTTDIPQGTNLYFTAAAAKAAAVADSITDAVTDIAPSQNAVFDALALKLSSVQGDPAPTLGGDLTLNAKSFLGPEHRAAVGAASSFIEEEYLHALTLTASQSGTSQSSLAFAFASFEGCEITYKIKEATTNRVRIGTLRAATNGTDVSISDVFSETGDAGVTWVAAINGSNLELRYTTTANNKTMRADVKRFKA